MFFDTLTDTIPLYDFWWKWEVSKWPVVVQLFRVKSIFLQQNHNNSCFILSGKSPAGKDKLMIWVILGENVLTNVSSVAHRGSPHHLTPKTGIKWYCISNLMAHLHSAPHIAAQSCFNTSWCQSAPLYATMPLNITQYHEIHSVLFSFFFSCSLP